MTNATLNLDWKIDTTYTDNESKLINFVKTELGNNKEHIKFRLSYQNKDTKDIITEDTRLFIYNDGTTGVAQFKKRARRYGTNLPLSKYFYKDKYRQYDLIKIEHLIPIQRKTESMKFHDNCQKILKHLSKYNLWTNYSLAIKTMDFLGLDLCKEIKRVNNVRLYGLKLTEVEKNKQNIDCVNRLAQRLRLIAQTCNDNDVKANIMEHCNSVINLSGIKIKSDYENEYIYPLKDMLYCGNIFSLVDCLYEIEHAKVVKMRFTKRAGMFNDECFKRIKNSMENKTDCKFSSYNGYDVSFEYNAKRNKAWYALEYRNCGNGHYFIALNDTHALFVEDD